MTLEVTPEQAEKLDLARSVGTLSLVLRNQTDLDPSKTVGITKEMLLAKVAPPPPPAAAASSGACVRKPAPVKRAAPASQSGMRRGHPRRQQIVRMLLI